jgi:hypothetical protein
MFIAYICLTMGSQKALRNFECTIASTRLGYEAQYKRVSSNADVEFSDESVVSGRESFNSEYDRMLHRESKMMSLYIDEIVLQFLAGRESLVQQPVVEA